MIDVGFFLKYRKVLEPLALALALALAIAAAVVWLRFVWVTEGEKRCRAQVAAAMAAARDRAQEQIERNRNEYQNFIDNIPVGGPDNPAPNVDRALDWLRQHRDSGV
jgi:hypothetical protein